MSPETPHSPGDPNPSVNTAGNGADVRELFPRHLNASFEEHDPIQRAEGGIDTGEMVIANDDDSAEKDGEDTINAWGEGEVEFLKIVMGIPPDGVDLREARKIAKRVDKSALPVGEQPTARVINFPNRTTAQDQDE